MNDTAADLQILPISIVVFSFITVITASHAIIIIIMSSLTDTEQRFVLAEVIKSSSVDIRALASFVRSNSIIPDWYNMQLPHGRNLNQCIKFAQALSIPAPSTQQSTPSNLEHGVQSITDYTRRHMPPASPTRQHPAYFGAVLANCNILPRPANGTEGNNVSLAPAPKLPTKKRGRPSRSENSRRDMPPREPLPIAPRPPLPALGSNAPPPRTLLPALNRNCEPHPTVSSAGSPPTTKSLDNGSRSRKKQRLDSPPSTPVVMKGLPPSRSLEASSPSAIALAAMEQTSNGQETSHQTSNNKKSTPETGAS